MVASSLQAKYLQSDQALPLICVSPDLRPGIDAIIRSLDQEGLLQRFITTIALEEGRKVDEFLSAFSVGRQVKRLLARRNMNLNLNGRLTTYPRREIVRATFARYGANEILSDRVWWWAERGFDRAVASKWAGRCEFLYGFEFASAETFRRQKQFGGKTILNQLIAHHKTSLGLITEEFERYPDAVTQYDRHLMRSATRVNDLKDQQYEQSDLIVANSDFVRQSFIDAGIRADKVVVLPGAAPTELSPQPKKAVTDRIVFLSAGTQSIRKGTPYLLQAWKKGKFHDAAELRLVGKNTLPLRLFENLPGNVLLRSTVSQAEMFRIYSEASVLVLPSLCEGFALVILEAMAHGLPIITTENSGCGSFVEDGVNGWIVPIRDPEKLYDRISWCIENKERLAEMGQISRDKASRWTWDDYSVLHGKTISAFVNDTVNGCGGTAQRIIATSA